MSLAIHANSHPRHRILAIILSLCMTAAILLLHVYDLRTYYRPVPPSLVSSISHSTFVASDLLRPHTALALAASKIRVARSGFGIRLLALLLIGGVESNPGPDAPRRNFTFVAKPLLCAVLNVRSAVNKSAEIHDLIESNNLDVLVLTETWIAQNAPAAIKNDIAPRGYRVCHVHRTALRAKGRKPGQLKGGGGLAVIYRDTLGITDSSSLLGANKTFESILVKITSRNKCLNLIGIYRPTPPATDSHFFNELSNMLDIVDLLPEESVVCGDFNAPGSSQSSVDTRLQQQLSDRNYCQHVTSSTRKQNGNILDLVIARSGLITTSSVKISEVAFSDHNLVTFDVNIAAPPARIQSFSFRDINKIDTKVFMSTIIQSPIWLSPPQPVDEYYCQFKSDVTAALDKLAPLKHRTKRVGTKPTASWMTDEVRELKTYARRLERRFKSNGRKETDYVNYRRANRTASKAIKAARTAFYRHEITSQLSAHDSRTQWKTMKEILHSDDRVPPVNPEESSRLVSSFTSFFHEKLAVIRSSIISMRSSTSSSCSSPPPSLSSSLPFLAGRHPPTPLPCRPPHLPLPPSSWSSLFPPSSLPSSLPPPPSSLTSLHPVSAFEVDHLLSTTSNKSSPLDFIPTSLLKSCSAVFSPLIANLTNRSFTQGTFPSALKTAQVTPLLKKPTLDPKEPSNYRPISNLNTIGKLVERLALTRLRPHIIHCPNFSPVQSAYRPGHSTETALLDVTNTLHLSSARRRVTLLCTIDLSAAFDTIDHEILLDRLKTDFGLDGTVGSWLRSYVVGRSQFVKVGSAIGNVTPTVSGVPQGSVLGPILFAAYMSPIDRLVRSHSIGQHHYADDTTLFVELHGPNDFPPASLTNCVDSLTSWCLQNYMVINAEKTEAMLVSSANQLKLYDRSHPINVAKTSIVMKDTVKILGVTLDSQLSFDSHVTAVSQSCNFHIRALRHIRPMLSVASANQLACSIVASRLDYCNSLLVNTSKHNIDRLQRLQNKLARIVCGAPARATALPLLHNLHWLPIDQRITYKICTLTYSALSSSTPPYLRNALTPYVPTRLLRSSDAKLLSIPPTDQLLVSAKNAFSIAAPTIWNSLSLATRLAPSLNAFKRKLKTELFTFTCTFSDLCP